MNHALIELLRRLPSEPHVVVDLYRELFSGHFWILAQRPVLDFATLQFLTYPAGEGIRELPLFTSADRRLLIQLAHDVPEAEVQKFDGAKLWPRIIDVLESEKTFVAIDATEIHGIRLTKAMILGIVNLYGVK
jgi:hypothetical protein